jgi:hypothetical protein
VDIYRGNQFVLLPWGDAFREGWIVDSGKYGHEELYPVLCSFTDPLNRCCPSQNVLAALSGIRKQSIAYIISEDEAYGLITKRAVRNGKRCYTEYTLHHKQYGTSDLPSTDFIPIGYTILRNGLWALMSSATKLLYITLLAHCYPGHHATVGWVGQGNDSVADAYAIFDASFDEDGNRISYGFIPQSKILPGEFARLAGIPSKTYRNARTWLVQNGLLRPNTEYEFPGWIVNWQTNLWVPGIFERLAKQQADDAKRLAKATRSAKASTTHMRKADTGRDLRLATVPDGFEATVREPRVNGHVGTVSSQTAGHSGHEGTAIAENAPKAAMREPPNDEAAMRELANGHHGTVSGHGGTVSGHGGTVSGHEGTGSYSSYDFLYSLSNEAIRPPVGGLAGATFEEKTERHGGNATVPGSGSEYSEPSITGTVTQQGSAALKKEGGGVSEEERRVLEAKKSHRPFPTPR